MKTTKSDFNRFKKAFIHWQHKLGLTQYRVDFHHEPLGDCFAQIVVQESEKVATCSFSSVLPDHINYYPPEISAKHEAMHLLLNRIQWLGSMRYIEITDLREEDEAIVRRLEKVL